MKPYDGHGTLAAIGSNKQVDCVGDYDQGFAALNTHSA
jgi:hypothetical protein